MTSVLPTQTLTGPSVPGPLADRWPGPLGRLATESVSLWSAQGPSLHRDPSCARAIGLPVRQQTRPVADLPDLFAVCSTCAPPSFRNDLHTARVLSRIADEFKALTEALDERDPNWAVLGRAFWAHAFLAHAQSRLTDPTEFSFGYMNDIPDLQRDFDARLAPLTTSFEARRSSLAARDPAGPSEIVACIAAATMPFPELPDVGHAENQALTDALRSQWKVTAAAHRSSTTNESLEEVLARAAVPVTGASRQFLTTAAMACRDEWATPAVFWVPDTSPARLSSHREYLATTALVLAEWLPVRADGAGWMGLLPAVCARIYRDSTITRVEPSPPPTDQLPTPNELAIATTLARDGTTPQDALDAARLVQS